MTGSPVSTSKKLFSITHPRIFCSIMRFGAHCSVSVTQSFAFNSPLYIPVLRPSARPYYSITYHAPLLLAHYICILQLSNLNVPCTISDGFIETEPRCPILREPLVKAYRHIWCHSTVYVIFQRLCFGLSTATSFFPCSTLLCRAPTLHAILGIRFQLCTSWWHFRRRGPRLGPPRRPCTSSYPQA